MKQLSAANKVNSFNLKVLKSQLLNSGVSQSGLKSIDDKEAFIDYAQTVGENHQFRAAGSYSQHFLPNAKYYTERVQVLGNAVRIHGFVDDDYNSNDTLLNKIE